MFYDIWAGIVFIIAFFLFFIAIYMRMLKKQNIYGDKILGDKNEKMNIEKVFLKLIMPNEEKLKKIKNYISILKLEIKIEKMYILAFGISLVFGVVYFGMVVYFANVTYAFIAMLIGASFGYKLPEMILKSRFEELQEDLQLGILPYIEMLQAACQAGLTLTLAIDRIHRHYPTPLALEFKNVNNDYISNIKSRREAYDDLMHLVGGDDIRSLVEALTQSLEIGTPMKNVLFKQAESVRSELRKKIKAQGQAAKWKNFVISIGFQLPPYLFIVIGPSFFELIKNLA